MGEGQINHELMQAMENKVRCDAMQCIGMAWHGTGQIKGSARKF